MNDGGSLGPQILGKPKNALTQVGCTKDCNLIRFHGMSELSVEYTCRIYNNGSTGAPQREAKARHDSAGLPSEGRLGGFAVFIRGHHTGVLQHEITLYTL